MKELKTFDFKRRGGGAKKYDFDTLFSGKPYELKRAEDFGEKSSLKSLRGYLGTKASAAGKTLRTEIVDKDTLVVQAFDKDPNKPARKKPAAKTSAKKTSAKKTTPKSEPEAENNGKSTSGVNADALAGATT